MYFRFILILLVLVSSIGEGAFFQRRRYTRLPQAIFVRPAPSTHEAPVDVLNSRPVPPVTRPVNPQNPSFYDWNRRMSRAEHVDEMSLPIFLKFKATCKIRGYREMQPATVEISPDLQRISLRTEKKYLVGGRQAPNKAKRCREAEAHWPKYEGLTPVCFSRRQGPKLEEFELKRDAKGLMLQVSVRRPHWLAMKEEYGLDCFSDPREDRETCEESRGGGAYYCQLDQ